MQLELKNVVKRYIRGDDEVYALGGVSMKVDTGEFLAIVGKSGSGKSTLMHILGCLDTPTEGEYLLGGETVSDFSDKRLSYIRNRQIGFVFQGFHLIPSLSALENVELPLLYQHIHRRERRAMALEALSKVGLGTRVDHRPGEMSGGQQQRVAIARAIAVSPSIILADEPTGNLDTAAGREIMELLLALHAEGRTVVLITHDLGLAGLARRQVRLQDGKIVA